MPKRWWFALLILLLGVGSTSAQDGGSTLQAWADSPASAIDLTHQMGWPTHSRQINAINTYAATGDPTLSCASSHAYSLWATFVAPQTGFITIQADGSNYDNVIALYKTSATAANEVRCANALGDSVDKEAVRFNVTAGTRYYVIFAAAGTGVNVGATSALTFTTISNSLPGNAFQIPASGSYSTVQLNIENADATLGSTGMCSSSRYFVYYRFKPAVSGRYEFSTNGSSYDTMMTIADNLGPFACNENINSDNVASRLRPNLTAGRTYLITIGQSPSIAIGNPILSLSVRKL